MRILAASTPHRFAAIPEVPTMDGAGLPGFDMSNSVGLMAPCGTPEAVIATLNGAANLAAADAGVREIFLRNGAEALGSTPQEFPACTRSERVRFAEAIRQTGMRLD